MNTSAVTINEVLTPCSLGWMGHNAWWHCTKPPECAALSPLFLPPSKLRWDEALICCGWFLPCLNSLSYFGWHPSSVGMWRSGIKFFLTIFTQISSLHSHLLRNQQGVEVTTLWCHRALMLLPTLSTYQGIRA